MKNSRCARWLILALLLIMGIAWSTSGFINSRAAERAQVRIRYDQMHRAIIARDEEAALGLIVPANRGHPDTRVLGLDFVVQPLNERSWISILGNNASITPRRKLHYYVLPGGNSVSMLKVGGEWYFTGKVSVD